MPISNPRFPHFCRILRYGNEDPMRDQSNVLEDSYPSGSSDRAETVIYEGICRSDNREFTSDKGEVNVSYRTLALPQKQDEWTEDTIPLEGDKVELQRFGYKEYGLVIDKRPSNLGTHILWRYVRS